ncbi:hypothetical protein O3M35_011809 [Rhynocoris fuscipes]|uniref:Uncharacterized protein n=1 Tax=Rhynocoris fuscipes TaxID=488301 RepID=A0AAW1D2V5_9HEMI
MATNVNKNLQIKLIELKQKAAEAEELRERRDKLIETFEKLNLDIPIEIKLNYDSSTELDNEGLRDKVRYYNNENRNLENYLNACNKIKDESEMLIRENHKLKRDLEMLQSTEKLDLKDYIKHVVERLKLLETERDKLMDRLLSKDCKIDIMTSKLSHILVQLQEPIKELKAKEQQDSANLSNDEKLLLKLAEISVSNDQLKTRIEQLKELTTELYNEYDLITDKIIKYLEQLDKVGRDPEALIEKRTNSDSTY